MCVFLPLPEPIPPWDGRPPSRNISLRPAGARTVGASANTQHARGAHRHTPTRGSCTRVLPHAWHVHTLTRPHTQTRIDRPTDRDGAEGQGPVSRSGRRGHGRAWREGQSRVRQRHRCVWWVVLRRVYGSQEHAMHVVINLFAQSVLSQHDTVVLALNSEPQPEASTQPGPRPHRRGRKSLSHRCLWQSAHLRGSWVYASVNRITQTPSFCR